MKRTFSTELAYILGIPVIALAAACMARADFGLSMVVAPAYILHLKISQTLPWYSFGMSEYLFQGALLILLAILMRKFKKGYLFSFVTAVLYGLLLDGFIALLSLLPLGGMAGRIIYYVVGVVVCAVGVALVFHTYIAPEAYELFVKELSEKTGIQTGIVKTAYDCASCAIGILLSFLFFGFGRFEGVKLGTILCALVNGWLISRISQWLDRKFDFQDTLPLRKYFDQ